MAQETKTVETRYVYDKYGYPIFKIDIADPGEYKDVSFNAKVYEITSWSPDDKKEPYEEDNQLYISCYIKWDSCMHFYFGEEDENGSQDGYLHMHDLEGIERHHSLLRCLYYTAFERMEREPES